MNANVAFILRPATLICYFCAILLTLCMTSKHVYADVGATIPFEVDIPIGGNTNITCRMNISFFNENNSSCLTFFKEGNEMISKEHIHVVNETSIVYMMQNATAQNNRYVCKCNKMGVGATAVRVGTPPINVTDFRCWGYDFSYLICNFTAPKNNISTLYDLEFTTEKWEYKHKCNLTNGYLDEMICNISTEVQPLRVTQGSYSFKLASHNTLGDLTQYISINYYESIIPAKPVVETENITASSVVLSWIVPKYSQYKSYTNNLRFKIQLKPEKFDVIHIDSRLVKQTKQDFRIAIENLEFAFRRYEVKVWVKTGLHENDETMWSEPYYGTFVSRPRRPDNPPEIDVGSFYIDPTGESLRLYWKQLPEYRENGPHFQYVITEVRQDGNMINTPPENVDNTSATFRWKSTSQYEFKVKSQNQVGQSLNTSVLVVPSRRRYLKVEQIQITKVFHNQSYTISWQPTDVENLTDFTVFWCHSKMESQSQCKGTISFRHFDKDTFNYTTEPQVEQIQQNFAVSANYPNYSTGMIWAMCTANSATDLTKMEPEATPISSDSIKLQWSTDCLYMAILEGYNMTYCKAEKNGSETWDCVSPAKTISISKMRKEYTIGKLEPFATYKIWIFMYSKAKVGPVSTPVIATTKEDAPTEPRQLRCQSVSSKSAVISWLPPEHSNGKLRFYTVWQNNNNHTVVIKPNDTDGEIFFKLEDLSSYTVYKIYVTANTEKRSPPSNDIHIQTSIGYPTVPLSPRLIRNENTVGLTWDPPFLPSGPIEFYEVRVKISKNNKTEVRKISRVRHNTCQMSVLECYDQTYSYSFEVRAVNAVKKGGVDGEHDIFSKCIRALNTTQHQGAVKRRRHSNAEITSISGTYLNHETTERLSRRRHELENVKTSTTEMPYALEKPLIKPIAPVYSDYEGNIDNFMCVDRNAIISAHYDDPNLFKLFYSDWATGAYYDCVETQISKTTYFALLGLFVSILTLAIFYSAHKKYDKMSDIRAVVPIGLDGDTNSTKGVDNTIERDESTRSDEPFYDKESHRLLSKIGNDSGLCLDKGNIHVCSDHQDSEKSSQSTDSVELNDITSCSYTSSPSHSPNANVRDTAVIPDQKFTPTLMQTTVQLRASDNGYIKPIMMSNGYVQPQSFQKLPPRELPSMNGYTKLDDMGKPIFPQISAAAPMGDGNFGLSGTKAVSNKGIVTPQPMSGYVTHKQLSDYGQRLQ